MNAHELTDTEMQLLSDVLCGDRSERDLEVQTAAVANPTFRRQLEELRQLRDGLEAAGSREREILSTASEPVAPADAALVAATLRKLVPPARQLRLRWAWLAAAAAAVLLVAWWAGAFGGAPSRNDDQRQLAGEVFSARSAKPATDGGIDLAWTCTLAGATFVVTVSDPLDLGWTPVQSPELNAPRWHLDPGVVAKLPPTALWRVTARIVEAAGQKSIESADLPLR